MAGSLYESVLCVKTEVFVYNIPARTSNRGYRAADWTLDKPDWVGRLKVVSKNNLLFIRLEDKNSGELFAQCPVDCYPGAAIEQVLDSSRYFVIRIKDESGRSAFIGMGFADRGDSFDLLVAIQDHFKWVKRESDRAVDEAGAEKKLRDGPKLDLSFKEGQTIKININTKRQGEDSETGPIKPRGRPQGSGAMGILPPPPGPGGSKIVPPPRAPSAVAATSQNTNNTASLDLLGGSRPLGQGQTRTGASGSNSLDLLMNLGHTVQGPTSTGFQPLQPQPLAAAPPQNNDPWGDFASASGSASSSQSNSSGNDWVSFE